MQIHNDWGYVIEITSVTIEMLNYTVGSICRYNYIKVYFFPFGFYLLVKIMGTFDNIQLFWLLISTD